LNFILLKALGSSLVYQNSKPNYNKQSLIGGYIWT
jgi:hypothetical protein